MWVDVQCLSKIYTLIICWKFYGFFGWLQGLVRSNFFADRKEDEIGEFWKYLIFSVALKSKGIEEVFHFPEFSSLDKILRITSYEY